MMCNKNNKTTTLLARFSFEGSNFGDSNNFLSHFGTLSAAPLCEDGKFFLGSALWAPGALLGSEKCHLEPSAAAKSGHPGHQSWMRIPGQSPWCWCCVDHTINHLIANMIMLYTCSLSRQLYLSGPADGQESITLDMDPSRVHYRPRLVLCSRLILGGSSHLVGYNSGCKLDKSGLSTYNLGL